MQNHPGSESKKPIEVSLAILYPDNIKLSLKIPIFLMQLRDDLPNILYPGHWGLFGGHLDPGEKADVCIHRELTEEIGRDISDLKLLKVVEKKNDNIDPRRNVIVHLFRGVLDVPMSDLILGEGMDLKLVSPEELRKGEAWSETISETRPMGDFHRRTLLDFWGDLKSSKLKL
ncbi:MAG: NUDIX domain-containing protein [Cyanophyceae cyanobacterium]